MTSEPLDTIGKFISQQYHVILPLQLIRRNFTIVVKLCRIDLLVSKRYAVKINGDFTPIS